MRKTCLLFVILLGCFELTADEATANPVPLFDDLARRSHPPRYELVSFFNPWGEELFEHEELPDQFGQWIATAARVYAEQGIRFDGYMGSVDDGRHYESAADGEDTAYIGDRENQGYREEKDSDPDDLRERVWICLDLPMHALTLAGFPIRAAMAWDFNVAPEVYTLGGTFSENVPDNLFFFRRIRNLKTFFLRNQHYVELRVTAEQYRDRSFRPESEFRPGDVVFFGHYGDPQGTGGDWHPKHSGIVARVDDRGLPATVYNMRVSRDLLDYYDGEMNQIRKIDGEEKLFKRYSDRYSLIGFGRIVHPYRAEADTSDNQTDSD